MPDRFDKIIRDKLEHFEVNYKSSQWKKMDVALTKEDESRKKVSRVWLLIAIFSLLFNVAMLSIFLGTEKATNLELAELEQFESERKGSELVQERDGSSLTGQRSINNLDGENSFSDASNQNSSRNAERTSAEATKLKAGNPSLGAIRDKRNERQRTYEAGSSSSEIKENDHAVIAGPVFSKQEGETEDKASSGVYTQAKLGAPNSALDGELPLNSNLEEQKQVAISSSSFSDPSSKKTNSGSSSVQSPANIATSLVTENANDENEIGSSDKTSQTIGARTENESDSRSTEGQINSPDQTVFGASENQTKATKNASNNLSQSGSGNIEQRQEHQFTTDDDSKTEDTEELDNTAEKGIEKGESPIGKLNDSRSKFGLSSGLIYKMGSHPSNTGLVGSGQGINGFLGNVLFRFGKIVSVNTGLGIETGSWNENFKPVRPSSLASGMAADELPQNQIGDELEYFNARYTNLVVPLELQLGKEVNHAIGGPFVRAGLLASLMIDRDYVFHYQPRVILIRRPAYENSIDVNGKDMNASSAIALSGIFSAGWQKAFDRSRLLAGVCTSKSINQSDFVNKPGSAAVFLSWYYDIK